ncbi:MAG: hypothetical protein LC800_00145 [Acidobacteria bacterium]|nr:hypothetical protein [Acidobacteriota bacterium]
MNYQQPSEHAQHKSHRSLVPLLIVLLLLLLLLGLVDVRAQRRTGARGRAGAAQKRPAAAALFNATLAKYADDGDGEAARRGLLKVIALAPDSAPAHYNLAVLAIRREDWGEAEKWFEKYLRLDSASPTARRAEKGLKYVRRARVLEASPEESARLKYEAAVLYAGEQLSAGRPGGALSEALRASRLAPQRWEAYSLASVALARMERFAEASGQLRRALELAPPGERGKLEAALARCEQGGEFLRLVAEGAGASRAGNHAVAGESLLKAWRMFPERAEHGLSAAESFALARNYAQSLSILEELRSSPNAAVAARARARLPLIKRAVEVAEGVKNRPRAPTAAKLKDPLEAAESELRRAQRDAEREEETALEDARRRERRIRDILRDAESAERTARDDERAAVSFEREIIYYASQPSGAAASESARQSAARRRQDAARNLERARRLREEAISLGAESN